MFLMCDTRRRKAIRIVVVGSCDSASRERIRRACPVTTTLAREDRSDIGRNVGGRGCDVPFLDDCQMAYFLVDACERTDNYKRARMGLCAAQCENCVLLG